MKNKLTASHNNETPTKGCAALKDEAKVCCAFRLAAFQPTLIGQLQSVTKTHTDQSPYSSDDACPLASLMEYSKAWAKWRMNLSDYTR